MFVFGNVQSNVEVVAKRFRDLNVWKSWRCRGNVWKGDVSHIHDQSGNQLEVFILRAFLA